MEFGLLGPLVVLDGGTYVAVSAPRQRALLAALLLHADRVLAFDELAEMVWDGRPPPGTRGALHSAVQRLRAALGPPGHALIGTRPHGYLISLADGGLDVRTFEVLAAQGEAAAEAGRPAEAAHLLSEALHLWRGEPLADIPSRLLRDREAPPLAERRLQALSSRIEADLRLGRHAALVAELTRLTAEHPLRERFRGQLMLALYRAGRQADALAAYHDTRRILIGELGVEPGPDLRELHHRILSADPGLAPAAPSRATGSPFVVSDEAPRAGAPAAEWAVPHQLPAGPAHFTGRKAEQEALTRLLDQAAGSAGGVAISVIGGTAGVGKTALAVHWAHQVAERLADGQLYVNLRGFDPSGKPVMPADAIRGFLDALQVPAERIPATPEGQADLYRSLLARRRMLIVLDNARDVAQARPLLPGGRGCLVLVTSRTQLTSLVAVEGAHPVTLDVLTDAEARELLAGRLGVSRVTAEPGAVTELISACARLPLAVAIAAARAAESPGAPLATLAAGLREAPRRLTALDGGDTATDLRAVFSWSYRQLGDPAARTFRLLGVHPGPDISAAAAASLTGVSPPDASEALSELTRAHLLSERLPGRYAFHDLLRAYAADQARSQDTGPEHRISMHRVLDHYLHTAHTAALLLDPARPPLILSPPTPGCVPEGFPDHRQALHWCQAERRVLIAVVEQAARTGFDSYAWQVPCALATFFYQQGHWRDWAMTQQIALAAAQRLEDLAGQARAHLNLGTAHARLGSHRDGRIQLRQALALYRQTGDSVGEARVHYTLAVSLGTEGRHDEALHHARRVLELYEAAGIRSGQANGLRVIAWSCAQMGDHRQALMYSQQALRMHRESADRHGEAMTWDCLGYASHHLRRYRLAVACYRHALRIYGELDGLYDKAETLVHLGDTYQALGNSLVARDVWQQALTVLSHLHHPDAGHVRDRIRGLDNSVPA